MLKTEHVQLLKQFVALCGQDINILHSPEIKFFKDFLETLGAKIPSASSSKPTSCSENGDTKESFAKEEPTEEEEEEVVESDLELDNTGVIEPDQEIDLPMGDESLEATDEMIEKSSEKRSEATEAISDGNYEKALSCFTEAIKLNPGSALMHAKRASVLLRLNKPNAAIKDCDKALSINADSAPAYKYRGRAHGLLGHWEQAHTDLATACKIDYDDEANAWLKEIEPNFKKIYEHKRKHARKLEERAAIKLQERRKKAQEEYERKKHEPEDCCGGDDCSGMGNLPDFFNDPEVMTAFQDPEVMQAFADVSQNPVNAAKYQSNPKVRKVLEKLASKMGAGGGVPGAFFKPPSSNGESDKPNPQPKPDLDID